MAKNSIGLIELTSIAAGYLACDAMLKAADVEVVLSRSICSGKYMVMVRGDVAAVQAAVGAGISGARFSVIDSFVIPNLHEAVFPAISGATKVEALDALGIVESFSVASLIEGADAAVKTEGFPPSPGHVRISSHFIHEGHDGHEERDEKTRFIFVRLCVLSGIIRFFNFGY